MPTLLVYSINKTKPLPPLKFVLYEHFKIVGWNGISGLGKHMWSHIWANEGCGPYKHHILSKWNCSWGKKSAIYSGVFFPSKMGELKKMIVEWVKCIDTTFWKESQISKPAQFVCIYQSQGIKFGGRILVLRLTVAAVALIVVNSPGSRIRLPFDCQPCYSPTGWLRGNFLIYLQWIIWGFNGFLYLSR